MSESPNKTDHQTKPDLQPTIAEIYESKDNPWAEDAASQPLSTPSVPAWTRDAFKHVKAFV